MLLISGDDEQISDRYRTMFESYGYRAAIDIADRCRSWDCAGVLFLASALSSVMQLEERLARFRRAQKERSH